MKYKATLSTRNSMGHFNARTKEEIKDMLFSWFFEYGIDYKKHNVVPAQKKDQHSMHWQKGHIAISCNFHITELNK